MQIRQNISLKPYNTFGINVQAQYFATINHINDLPQLAAFANAHNNLPLTILGGGSNILFTKNYAGVIFKNNLQGNTLMAEDDDYYYVKSAAGENWHQFVLYCLQHNYAGVENLSLIPGNIGASPMQNIGAYGVEIKNVFHQLEAWHINDQAMVTFNQADCRFGYRESVFKHQYKGQFVITSVTFKLLKKPVFNTSYGAIQQELNKMGVTEISIQNISQAVINIRQSKLPDPAVIGNAGSFFKNPTIPASRFNQLKKQFENIVGYATGNDMVKVAAGWLIEHCGPTPGTSWKGYRQGDAGCNKTQALVLVNYANAKGSEVYDLSTQILQSVQNTFGIALEREVNIM